MASLLLFQHLNMLQNLQTCPRDRTGYEQNSRRSKLDIELGARSFRRLPSFPQSIRRLEYLARAAAGLDFTESVVDFRSFADLMMAVGRSMLECERPYAREQAAARAKVAEASRTPIVRALQAAHAS